MALAPSALALRLPQTCGWTYGLASDISFSRRLSPLKGIRNPNSIRVRARAAASFFFRFQLNVGHPRYGSEIVAVRRQRVKLDSRAAGVHRLANSPCGAKEKAMPQTGEHEIRSQFNDSFKQLCRPAPVPGIRKFVKRQ